MTARTLLPALDWPLLRCCRGPLLPALALAVAVAASGCAQGESGPITPPGGIAGLPPAATGVGVATWQPVFSVGNTVLSVWGATPDRVFFAGGGLATAGREGPFALLFEGASWRWLDATAAGSATLRAVHGTSATDVWFVGDAGTALHYDGFALTRVETGTTATLFAVHAVSPGEVWAVGGTPGDPSGEQDLILRLGAAGFEKVEPPARLGLTYLSIGYQPNTGLVVAGEGGMMAVFDGAAFGEIAPPGQQAVSGFCMTPTELLAVGGPPALAVQLVASTWQPLPVQPVTQATALDCAADGTVLLVGMAGTRLRRSAGQWIDESVADPAHDYHAVWSDGAGNAFAVGGNFLDPAAPERTGFIMRYGTPVPVTQPTGP